jgi:hypothetical protein
MSDALRRLSRWQAKYSPEIAAQTTARIYDDMSKRYQASMVALYNMEAETKQVLDSSGIDTMYIVFYLDYARQLFKLSHGRTISGPTLAKEAQVLLQKWQNRGGDTSATRSSRRSLDVSPSASPRRDSLRRLQHPRAGTVAATRPHRPWGSQTKGCPLRRGQPRRDMTEVAGTVPDRGAWSAGDCPSPATPDRVPSLSLFGQNDLPHSLCLSLSLRLCFPHKVHARRQRPHIVRARPEVQHLPPRRIQQAACARACA